MRTKPNVPVRFICLCLLVTLGGCSSTRMTSSWRLPETGPLQFSKVMALVLVQDASIRRAGESEMVRQIRGEAIPSYRLLDEQDIQNEDLVREAIEGSGVDGVIVVRPVYDEKEITYTAGTYPGPYYSFWGYYGWAYPVAYGPGYFNEDRLVGVETNIYDVKTGKLAWSGLSQTKNPDGVRKLVAETAKVVRKEMKKYGFLE